MRKVTRSVSTRQRTLLVATLGVAWIGACSREPAAAPPAVSTPAATAPAASPAATPAPAVVPAAAPTPAPAAVGVLARQAFNTDPELSCEVLEVRRVSGGALLVKWRLIRPPAATAGLASDEAKGVYHTWSWDGVYFTDAAENKKYSGLRDTAGAWLGQGDTKSYKPGDQQAMWMKFPAPPDTSARITFVFPGFAPFEDLPIAR